MRPELIEAFNNVCDRIDREIRAELQQRKPLLKDASTCTTEDKPREDQLVIIDRLEKENARLRSELSALMADKNGRSVADLLGHPTHGSVGAVEDTESTGTTSDGAKLDHSELAVLQLRFNALSGNFKKARDALQRRSHERDEWIRRANLLKRIIRTAEEEHGIRLLERGHQNLHVNKPNVSLILDDGFLRTRSDEEPIRQEDDSMQSTQGDSEEEAEEEELPPLPVESRKSPVSIKREPSSDAPIIVFERVLKKRKVETGVPEATKVRRMKAESNDSSPILGSERRGLNTQESLDLDDIAQRMPTPRKRKDVDDPHQSESADEGLSPLEPPSLFECLSNHQPLSHVDTAQILTPISGNRQSKSLIDDEEETPLARKGLGRGIEALADDGINIEKGLIEKKQRSSNTHTPGVEGRLNSLLNTPIAKNRLAISSPARSVLQGSPQIELGIPERRELPFDQQSASKQSNRRHWAEAKATPRPRVDDERTPARVTPPLKRKPAASLLRQKPLADLRLDDFKINPAANNGNDFAFSEVVRDKDDRASLRGCTDEHCCGKQFRALALSQRPDPPLTAAQRQEEQKLLEKYLGDSSYKLATMTKEEKADLWVEAKTEELANKYGKHRHQFSRMQSPPGFWNADFPSTQQLEAEKEEASRRERQAVAERHREAMRPRGRWKFRDE